tara:strand:- start:10858 stop:12063 length:1206 start_codon:yes stop_codon:yes gene_type:complete
VLYNNSVDLYFVDSVVIFLLSEVSNLFFCAIILLLLFYFKTINKTELIFWFTGFSSIIILAPFIQELFPDSGGYLRCVRDFKDNLSFDEIGCQASITAESESFQFFNFKRSAPAIYYSIIPIPSIATIMSLAFINKIYLLFTYIFIRNRINSSDVRFYLLLLFFFPTILLYSATGLREIFILILQSFLLITIIERKWTISSLLILLLASIKTQNAAVFLILYTGVLFFRADKSFSHLLGFLIILGLTIISFEKEILGVINYFRIGFLNEMGMIPPSGFVSEYKSIPTLIINAPIIFLQGIFSPGFGLGGLNLVFFPESILYIVLFILGARRSNYFSESLNWLVFFVFCVGIVLNSIVVENDSTFLRYRFTFIYLLMTHLLLFMGKKETKLPREDIKTIYQF